MNLALLANPAARRGGSAPADRAAGRLRALGIRTTLVSGGSAAESEDLLRAALDLGADAVAVAGGDGTVNVALQVMAGTGIPLGIVPTGTGNDIATTLGIAELDVDAAVDVIARGATRDIDLARVTRADGTTRLFASALASGLDARVNERANAMTWPRGGSRYTIALVAEVLASRRLPYTVELEHADGTVARLESDLVMATVANGRTYGGGIPIAPDADPADGLLDVVLVMPEGRMRLLTLLPRAYRGTHTTLPQVRTHRVRRATLSSPDLTAYADGDPVGMLPLTVEVVPGALRVFAG